MTTPTAAAAAALVELPAALERCRAHGMEVDVPGLLKHMMAQPIPAPAPPADVFMKYTRQTKTKCTTQLVTPHGGAVETTATTEAHDESLSSQAASSRAPSGHGEAMSTVRTRSSTSRKTFSKAAMDIKPYPQ
uniref:Uncharacterized protein n=1 Tax=Phaeocystis antarctica TaxID=33657 RepID=A0A7S0EFG9_9EUKA|mmetsp:Transcript_21828/g.51732  ORF Transcript_21828/g.51732 Transcript_21828/m.51732 type:complete len:133 (+) Transcript_21828:28-426(+)|eukprot:scaffold65833_cov42-Phaeocystis_antarctica.AAC.2